MSSQSLCVKLSLSYLVLSVSIELLRNGEQAFSMCVHPCPRYLTLESAGCVHCDVLPSRTLRSRLAFFHNEGAQARVPRGSGPAAAEAQRRLQSWGSQIDLSAELETDTALSLPSPDRFSASSRGWEARAAVSSARSRDRHFNYLILKN